MSNRFFSNTGLALGNGSTPLPNIDDVLKSFKEGPGDPDAGVQFPLFKFILDDEGHPAFGSASFGSVTVLPAKMHWGEGGALWVAGKVSALTGLWPKTRIENADTGDERRGQFAPEVGAKVLIGLFNKDGKDLGEIASYIYEDDVIEPASMAAVIRAFEDPNTLMDLAVPDAGITY